MEQSDTRSAQFVAARQQARGLSSYPGQMPATLDEAYAIQDSGIEAWPDDISGWKVGGIHGDWSERLGTRRLAGPVFRKTVHQYAGPRIDMPVFAEGFAAVEGEVTAVLAMDAPANKTSYTTAEALDLVEALHIGVEIASSPFAEINDHGPLVTISDFGNNYGLILGPEIPNWREMEIEDWVFSTQINGELVGEAAPTAIPGGPIDSVRFLLENVARRGRPAKAGMMILTSAVTGVHRAYSGDEAAVSMNGSEPITCRLIPEKPVKS